MKNNINALAG